MDCKHEFIGGSDGVTCRLCGQGMTQEQYRLFLHPPEPKEPEEPEEQPAPADDEPTPKKKQGRKEART